MADTGMGVETAACRFGLDFIALVRERYFFAIRKSALETPAMRDLLSIMRSPDYVGYVGQLAGYDARDTGRLPPKRSPRGAPRTEGFEPTRESPARATPKPDLFPVYAGLRDLADARSP